MQTPLQNIKHIEKWLEGKPFLVALLGLQTAASTDDLAEAFSQLKSRRQGNHQYPLPHLPAWFRLYRSHRRIKSLNREMFADFLPSGAEHFDTADQFLIELSNRKRNKTVKQESSPSLEDIDAARVYMQTVLTDFSQDLDKDISGAPPTPEESEIFKRWHEENEMVASFFFLVQLPCFLLFQTAPTELYRRARVGDVDALDKLLRLDPLMLHDPMIGKQLLKIRYEGKVSIYRRLLDAPLKSPGKLSRKSLKANMAALLSSLAIMIKQPLTEPQIKDLFDAGVKDRTKDPHAIDEGIPEAPESFARKIRRKRKHWINAMNPDKKI